MFAFSSSGYTNCQLTRQGYNYISRSDKIKDAKWDIYELRSGGGDNSIHFPSDNQGKVTNCPKNISMLHFQSALRS